MKKIYVKGSDIQGYGVFAAKDIKKEEIIARLVGPRIKYKIKNAEESKRYENWVGLGRNIWIHPNGNDCIYLNHSCSPNSAIIGTQTLVALKNIKVDDEIVFDYSMTDDDQYWEMKCNCETKGCRGVIRSVRHVPTDVFRRHYPNIPKYFQRIYIRRHVRLQSEIKSQNRIKSRS